MESHVTSPYSIINWHLTPESLHTAWDLMSHHPTVSYTDTWHQNPYILHGISCHITLQYHTLALDTRILTYCMESHVTSPYSIIHWHLDTRILTYCMESHVTSPYSIIHWHLTPESLHTAWNLMSHHITVSYTDTWHQNPYILHWISYHITLQYHTLTLDTRILTYCMESHVTSLYSIIHWHLTPESLHTAWNLMSHHSTVSYTDTLTPESLHTAWNLMSHHLTVSYTDTLHQNPYILHGISCHITLQYHTLTPYTRILTNCMESHVTSPYSIIHWHLTQESLYTAWNLMSHHSTVSYTDTWHQNPYILHWISCHITLQYHTLTPDTRILTYCMESHVTSPYSIIHWHLDTRILTYCMESHVTSLYSIIHWHLTPESLHTAWNLMSHHLTVSYTDTLTPESLHTAWNLMSHHSTVSYTDTLTPESLHTAWNLMSHHLYSIIHWHLTPESFHTAWNLMSHHSTVSYTGTWHQNPYILHGISCHITLQYHTLTPWHQNPYILHEISCHITLQYHTLTPWHQHPYILHGISCHITLQYHTLTLDTRILTYCMESHVTSPYSIIHWHLTPESLHTAWIMSHHSTVSYTDTWHQNPYILHGISCHITSTVSYTDTWHQNPYILHWISCHITLQYHTLTLDTRILTCCMESHVTSHYSITHWHLTPESLHTAWNLMSHHSTVSYTDTWHQNPYILHGISCHITLQYHTMTPDTRILTYCMESHVTSLYSIIHWHWTPESLHTAWNLMSHHSTVSYTDTLTPESLHTAWNLMSHHLTVSYTDTLHKNPYILHGISCHKPTVSYTDTLHQNPFILHGISCHITLQYHTLTPWHQNTLHTAWNLISHHPTVSYTGTWHQNPYILHGISCHITLQYHTLTPYTRILTYCMESHLTSLYSIIHWHLTPESFHTAWNLMSHHPTVSYTDTLTPESLHTAWNLMSHHSTVSYTSIWHQIPHILNAFLGHITIQ